MSEPQSFDVTQVIDESRISGAQWTVLGISLLTALFDGYTLRLYRVRFDDTPATQPTTRP